MLLHCDATQAVGKMPVDVDALGVDLMSFTAHKFYGPKGVGARHVRASQRRSPTAAANRRRWPGRERASGTLNVPGIVGFARAVALCVAEMPAERIRLAACATGFSRDCHSGSKA